MLQDTKLPPLVNRIKRQLFSRIWLARIVLAGFAVVVSIIAFVVVRPIVNPLMTLFSPLESDLNHSSGRTNIVFLGVGGPGHEAPDLTDTIILASVDLKTGQLSLLSIPRDIWVPSLRAKINTSYHYGEERRPGSGGLLLAKSSVSEITGIPIHYAAVLNFSAFVDLVDLIGGIDVTNQTAFTDDRYPLPGKEEDDCGGRDPEYLCRYESISFPAGIQHLDGITALKFVRSRHASSDEGTDYARSRRQSEVVKSIQAKLLELAKNPKNFTLFRQLYSKVTSSLITDFPLHQKTTLLKLGLLIRQRPLITEALSEDNALFHPPVSPLYDNQWVLVPKDNNPQVIFDFIANFID